jgi:hypothetical protein
MYAARLQGAPAAAKSTASAAVSRLALVAAGKVRRLALTAGMRKLLVIVNDTTGRSSHSAISRMHRSKTH